MLTTAYWACSVLGVGLAIAAVVRWLRGVGSRRGSRIERLPGEPGHHSQAGTSAEGVSAGGLGAEVAGDTVDMREENGAAPSVWDRWFSMRFWNGAITVFGVLGAWLTYRSSLTESAVFWIAVSAGLVFGQTLHQVGRLIEAPLPADSTDEDE